MDITASTITVVSSTFTLIKTIQDLVSDFRELREKVDGLGSKADTLNTVIRHVESVSKPQPGKSNPTSEEVRVREDIEKVITHCNNDLKRYNEELGKLRSERRAGRYRRGMVVTAWRSQVAGPKFEEIEKSLAGHQRLLTLLLNLLNKERLDLTHDHMLAGFHLLYNQVQQIMDMLTNTSPMQRVNTAATETTLVEEEDEVDVFSKPSLDPGLYSRAKPRRPSAVPYQYTPFSDDLFEKMLTLGGLMQEQSPGIPTDFGQELPQGFGKEESQDEAPNSPPSIDQPVLNSSGDRQDQEKGRELLQAIQERNMGKFDTLIRDPSTSIETRDDKNRTPLLSAAALGNADMVKRLLDSGAKPNEKDKSGSTALILACLKLRGDVISTILRFGQECENKSGTYPIEINAVDGIDKTAIHYCAESDLPEAEALIKLSRSQIDTRDKLEHSPLYYAIKYRKYTMVEALLHRRASIDFDWPKPTSREILQLLEAFENGERRPSTSSGSTGSSHRKGSSEHQPRRTSIFKRRPSSRK